MNGPPSVAAGSLGPQSTEQDFSLTPAWDRRALVHLISFIAVT